MKLTKSNHITPQPSKRGVETMKSHVGDLGVKLSLHYYICYISIAVVMLFVLTLFLISCADDYRTDPAGPPRTVIFAVKLSAFDENISNEEANIARSGGNKMPEPISSIVPLGNEWFMETTLVPTGENKTRSGPLTLEDGTHVCVAAFTTANAYVAHQHFSYSADGDSLRRVTNYLEVPEGTYKFVAYAYHEYTNNPILAAEFDLHFSTYSSSVSTLQNISPESDLLWGSVTQAVTVNKNEVEIPIRHLFSRIHGIDAVPYRGVPVTATPSNIANVTVNTYQADFTPGAEPPTPVLQKGDTIKYPVANTWASVVPDTVRSNDTILVYPGANTIIEFGQVRLGADTYNNVSTTFIHEMVSGYSYTLKVTFRRDHPIPDVSQPLAANTCVGAFWKANQTGERVIRIPGSGASSDWVAVVAWWDGRWHPGSGDGIVLAPGESSDAGIGTNSPANAEGFQVVGSTTLNGTASASSPILFRIGLQRKFSDMADFESSNPDYISTFPARYAVVLIYYKGLIQKLFLRQGEGADYLMKYGDADGSNALVADNRLYAARFSPYNLTATNLNAQVSVNGAPGSGQAAIFTEYPTQAGAFFQWANNGSYTRYAWQPFGATPWWSNDYPTGVNDYWLGGGSSNLYQQHESCPENYRRPRDGTTSQPNTAALVDSSEMRQSLWQNPPVSTNNNSANSVWGYYADGFFDRRLPAGGLTSTTTVAPASNEVAYVGRLFYNPTKTSGNYNASRSRAAYAAH